MRKFISLVSVLGAVAIAGTAFGAAPTKGGVYQGSIFDQPSSPALVKKVRLVVTKAGTSARVLWWCGTGRPPSTLRVQIAADGTFKGSSNTGTLVVWAIKGRFVSATKARVALQLKATCDGRGGNVNLELQS